jgi:hypothetical protein
MLSPEDQKDVRPDDWAMSKGITLGALTGIALSLVMICIAYYFNWSDVRTMVHLVLD